MRAVAPARPNMITLTSMNGRLRTKRRKDRNLDRRRLRRKLRLWYEDFVDGASVNADPAVTGLTRLSVLERDMLRNEPSRLLSDDSTFIRTDPLLLARGETVVGDVGHSSRRCLEGVDTTPGSDG